MNGTPLVSVIIPTYRRAHLVVRAVASVLRQTQGDLEVLVVDDSSPDDTAAVVRAIADTRVRYLRHDVNKGLPAVRNTGIRAARGRYIAFLDDDDEWREDKLEKQLKLLPEYDAVLCMGIADGYPLRVHNGSRITLDDLRRGSFNPSSLLARAEVLRDVLFDESLRQGEDWDAFIRIGQYYSIGWVPEPLLIYNEGGHDRMTNEKKHLRGPDLEKRTAVLYKHRLFFGERWFQYHLADTFLAYIASRSNRIECLAYAVRRCGVRPVAANLVDRMKRRIQRRWWRNRLDRPRATPSAAKSYAS